MKNYTVTELLKMYSDVGRDVVRIILSRSEFDKYRCKTSRILRITEEGLPELERQIAYNKTRRRARGKVCL